MSRALWLSVCLSLAPLPVLAQRTVALVIGIDSYDHIPDLAGAVNDAHDIADTLAGLGAEVTILLDHDASREAIMSTWTALAQDLGEGDRFIITYAGHGSNEPEAIPGEEDDGRDENWLLAGFSPFGEASGERIRDNEIAALFALSPEAEIVFVSDSCHSGTVSREIAPVLGYRFYRPDGTLADDPLPPPQPQGRGEFDTVAVYLGAVPDSQKVPEFLIDGQARGAMSWAFSKALRGGADMNGDGTVTAADLEIFVRSQVRDISRGLQRPQISVAPLTFVLNQSAPGAAAEADSQPVALNTVPADPTQQNRPQPPAAVEGGTADMTSDNIAPPAPAPGPPYSVGFADLPPVTLVVQGSTTFAPPAGARLVGQGAPADLVLETRSGVLRSMVGDLFARVGQPGNAGFAAGLQRAVDTTRLVNALMTGSAGQSLAISFAEGDGTYRAGDVVTVSVTGRRTRHLALVSIAPDGAVRALYPVQAPELEIDDPLESAPANRLSLAMQVGPPFGSDHMIAIETGTRSAALGAILAEPEAEWPPARLWSMLQASQAAGEAPRVTVFPFHSLGP